MRRAPHLMEGERVRPDLGSLLPHLRGVSRDRRGARDHLAAGSLGCWVGRGSLSLPRSPGPCRGMSPWTVGWSKATPLPEPPAPHPPSSGPEPAFAARWPCRGGLPGPQKEQAGLPGPQPLGSPPQPESRAATLRPAGARERPHGPRKGAGAAPADSPCFLVEAKYECSVHLPQATGGRPGDLGESWLHDQVTASITDAYSSHFRTRFTCTGLIREARAPHPPLYVGSAGLPAAAPGSLLGRLTPGCRPRPTGPAHGLEPSLPSASRGLQGLPRGHYPSPNSFQPVGLGDRQPHEESWNQPFQLVA